MSHDLVLNYVFIVGVGVGALIIIVALSLAWRQQQERKEITKQVVAAARKVAAERARGAYYWKRYIKHELPPSAYVNKPGAYIVTAQKEEEARNAKQKEKD